MQRTIEGMAASKLNTLHQHLTDTASVPIELASQPNITASGAYGPDQSYSAAQMKELVGRGAVVFSEWRKGVYMCVIFRFQFRSMSVTANRGHGRN